VLRASDRCGDDHRFGVLVCRWRARVGKSVDAHVAVDDKRPAGDAVRIGARRDRTPVRPRPRADSGRDSRRWPGVKPGGHQRETAVKPGARILVVMTETTTQRPDPGAAGVGSERTLPAVWAEGLIKDFGDQRAVDGIDLEVRQGEVFGVLGPNGAGKTTTMRM